jgi:hypothetical protein
MAPGPANRPNKASSRVSSPGLGPLRSLSHLPRGVVVAVGAGGVVVVLLFVFFVLLAVLCFPLGLGVGL